MKDWLKKHYRKLPIIRELHSLKTFIVAEGQQHRRLMQATAVIQALEALKMGNERYRDPKRLLVHGAQYFSQNYEDGMIAEIFRRIGTTTKTFLEIGVGNGTENNTASLLLAGWKGWWIDGDRDGCAAIRAHLKKAPGLARRLTLEESFVYPAEIAKLLARLNVPEEVDLFSLDIDLNTYHVWAALPAFRPRVVVVEYNASFPPDQIWIHALKADSTWDGTQLFGASLKAFEALGSRFGYSLVGCDILGNNALFVRNDLVFDLFASPFTAENHHEPARYALLYRLAHPPGFYAFDE